MSTYNNKIRKYLVKIEEDLNELVMDKLLYIKIELEEKKGEIMSLETKSSDTEDEYQQLYELHSTF